MPEGQEWRAVGQPLRRKEDLRLLAGAGRFSDDFTAPGVTHAVMVRSPHPHAKIAAIETARARAMPGVLAVLTGAECAADRLGPIPHEPVPSTKFDLKLTAPGGGAPFIGPHALLPLDRARHVGEAVAMVVAETEAQALDAAEEVQIAWEALPFVLDVAAALRPGAPAVWDEVPNNLLIETFFGDEAGTERAFVTAHQIVSLEEQIGRVTAVALEPRACLADIDAASGALTLYAPTGGAVRQKRELEMVLGLGADALRVVSADVGGNFGSKNRPYVEYALALWAARRLKRPVKYRATRGEAMLTDYQGRDLHVKASLALDPDGRFLALTSENTSNVGARCVSLSPLGKGAALITGSYAIPTARLAARAAFTNTMPTQAYRSSGRPEVTYVIETLADRAAAALGLDPLGLRRRNLVRADAMPYTNAVGARYDSGTYEANMDRVRRMIGWDDFAVRRRAAEARGRLLGHAVVNYVESSIGSPRERAEIRVLPGARVEVVIGTQPAGQGHETSFAQVISDMLAVPVECVRIVMGDTRIVSAGGGSHSGRSMRHAATVFARAADALIAKGRRIAAIALGVEADAVAFADGRFGAPASNRSFDFLELAEAARHLSLPADLADGLAVAADNEMHDPVFPNGAAACEIEIDPDTGALTLTRYAAADDVGRCINPLIVDGQTHGAIAQGLGQALMESCALDQESGQPLAGSLMDYALPRADALPSFATEIVEVLSPTNPLGIKAGGEGGTTPTLAVVTAALLDALRPLGITEIPMPVSPYALWQAMRRARR
ncbi:MAG TPA: xanthine dehydrogenase family protein molybdopterin-binding subunit [Stellaceae bacterium]|nr:xanthine dehydrogenase family protein molybdopterin-binding subunit [Stellaceae bacterium]